MKRLLIALLLCLAIGAPSLAAQPLITIDVHDADITDVIALLAAQSGRNIVADGSVKPQRLTLRLRNVTFDDALTVIVQSHDLQVRREGNILIVGASDAMNRRYGDPTDPRSAQTAVITLAHADPEQVAKQLTVGLPDGTVIVPDKRTGSVIVTGDYNTIARAHTLIGALDAPAFGGNAQDVARTFALRYLKPSDVVKTLHGVLPDGSYIADDAQNAIIVSGNEEVQNTAAQFVKSIDVPSPQVMFEVRVADVQPVNDTSNVGVIFGGVDLQGNVTPGSTSYAFARNALTVNATLNALVSQGRAEILATPKLVAINNKESDLLIGQTYPIIYFDARVGGQQVQFVDIGVKLRLTPTIGQDGSVTAELHPEYSEIDGFVSGFPIIANRKIDSTLRVRDNETIVLGGLMRDTSTDTLTKLPGLSNLPVFGKFFENRARTHTRDEVVFFITPHIIAPTSNNAGATK